MEPRIQYCTAKDGVNIAYSVIGEGVPFLQMPPFPSGSFCSARIRSLLPTRRAADAVSPKGALDGPAISDRG